MSNYYKPSGKFSNKSILIFLLMSITLYPLMGYIYSFGIRYVPIVYFLFIFTAIYGATIGFTTYLIFLFGKVRSKPVGYIFSTLGLLISLYFHWVFWVSDLIEADYIELALAPSYLIDVIKEINTLGTWNLKSSTVNGFLLTIIWIIEFIVIVVASFITTSGIGQINTPFCEENNQWFDSEELAPFNFIDSNKLFTKNMEIKESETLESIQKESRFETESHSVFTIYSSGTNQYYLSVVKKRKIMTKEGEMKFEDSTVFENLRINKEVAEKLKSI